ncbi:hypothetical protein [Rhodopirellula sp. MGV]|uniref:hypothetical protein n=1 Tax=Rhodopirellula sp. MGV TaxID=2023130 RepID=UPI00117BB7FD|nr:hypothetical protein [Rhodopirellula sp. MGV]
MDSSDPKQSMAWRWIIVCWAAVVLLGWVAISRYEFSTTDRGLAGSQLTWPESSSIPRSGESNTLLFFIHPLCPCTNASLHELERVIDRADLARFPVSIVVVASVPKRSGRDWANTEIIRSALQLPNSQLHLDYGGIESNRFAADVSGTTLLYSRDGNQLFAGGITISRGHEGDNVGASRLVAALNQPQTIESTLTPVFGCQLCGEVPGPTESIIP